MIEIKEGNTSVLANCEVPTTIPTVGIHPTALKLCIPHPEEWEEKPVAVLPYPKSNSRLIPARTLTTVRNNTLWAPLLNMSEEEITIDNSKEARIACVMPVYTNYVRQEITAENDCYACAETIYFAEEENLTDCDTASNLDSMSNFPVEFENDHHILKDPNEISHEECLPDLSHLKSILNEDQFAKMKAILNENKEIFSRTKNDLGCTHLIQHEIELLPDANPCREGLRRLSPEKLRQANEQLEALIQMGVIVPAKSPWSSAIVMAKKKGNQLRMCIDFRNLNAVTIKDAFPLPRMDDSLAKLGSAKYFSGMDVSQAFWQIPLEEKSQPLTAFAHPLGLYQ